jgi:hypothetical protein
MHIAYSAINPAQPDLPQQKQPDTENERLLRYQGYKYACDKYSHEIAAIQQYLPGWMPKFR